MNYTMPKDCIKKLSEDFAFYEFDCPCMRVSCDKTVVSKEMIDMIQKLREYTKFPISITSGYRCKEYQQDLRDKGYETSKGPSSHELGIAADILCGAYDGKQLAELAEKVGFKNIGIGRRFIHVDLREDGPRRWEYTI